jgi:hypothetical protein
VLSLLNQEFFDEIFRKEEEELGKDIHISSYEIHLNLFYLVSYFGPTVGQLIYHHAALENSFKQNNVGPDSKMIPLDDDFL